MRAFLLGILLALVAVTLASAEPTEIGVSVAAGARLPVDAQLTSLDGHAFDLNSAIDRPTVLLFTDYTCKTLCGPILSFVAHALEESKLIPGLDFKLIVIGLDPKDGADAARTMRHEQLGSNKPLVAASSFLRGDAAQLTSLTGLLGYHYRYDKTSDQFIHPVAAYILDKQGKVSRVLSGIALNGEDMRLGLVEAGQGKVGTLTDQIHLLCSSFDPTRGTYDVAISRVLAAASFATLLSLGGLIGFLVMARPIRRG